MLWPIWYGGSTTWRLRPERLHGIQEYCKQGPGGFRQQHWYYSLYRNHRRFYQDDPRPI